VPLLKSHCVYWLYLNFWGLLVVGLDLSMLMDSVWMDVYQFYRFFLRVNCSLCPPQFVFRVPSKSSLLSLSNDLELMVGHYLMKTLHDLVVPCATHVPKNELIWGCWSSDVAYPLLHFGKNEIGSRALFFHKS
jgi:hypothetical protein